MCFLKTINQKHVAAMPSGERHACANILHVDRSVKHYAYCSQDVRNLSNFLPSGAGKKKNNNLCLRVLAPRCLFSRVKIILEWCCKVLMRGDALKIVEREFLELWCTQRRGAACQSEPTPRDETAPKMSTLLCHPHEIDCITPKKPAAPHINRDGRILLQRRCWTRRARCDQDQDLNHLRKSTVSTRH